MIELMLQGQALELLPERVLWWPAKKTIILSDLHWGKSAHFRKHGVPMPGGTQDDDALRLAAVVRNYAVERMVIAGDFFHSKHNREVDDFSRWRNAHPSLYIDFVLGNHDILPRQAYKNWGLELHEKSLLLEPFLITHDDALTSEQFIIHGHIHPGIKLNGLGRQAFTLPAFCIDQQRMILPAFGKFTGCKLVDADAFEGVYVVGEDKVMKWK